MAMGKLVRFKARRKPGKKLPKRQKNAVVKLIRKELKANTELKYRDVSITGSFDDTAEVPTGGDGLIFGIVQGDTQQTRTGNSILIKRVSFKGTLRIQNTAAPIPNMIVNLALVRYPKCDGRAIVLGDIWQQLVDIGTSHREFDYKDDYKIVAFKRIKMGMNGITFDTAGTTTIAAGVTQQFSMSKSFRKGLKVTYDANAGAVTDVESNNLVLVAQVSPNTNTDDTVEFLASSCIFRIEFTDS